jgi:hypothetical protein
LVRSPELSRLRGRYLYTDNCAGGVRSLVPHPDGASDDRGTGIHVQSPSSFGEGVNGTVYVTSLSGPLYKLIQR